MTDPTGDRSRHFPSIERKHGAPVAHWLRLLSDLGPSRYPDQIAFLRENHGFSQAHANALVMYHRGSPTSRRHATPEECFSRMDARAARLAKRIFSVITRKHPDLELVVAWNQPMLRRGRGYVFGLSASKNHLTLNPFSAAALTAQSSRLRGLTVNKKTFTVPLDWEVDEVLLRGLVRVRLAEITAG